MHKEQRTRGIQSKQKGQTTRITTSESDRSLSQASFSTLLVSYIAYESVEEKHFSKRNSIGHMKTSEIREKEEKLDERIKRGERRGEKEKDKKEEKRGRRKKRS